MEKDIEKNGSIGLVSINHFGSISQSIKLTNTDCVDRLLLFGYKDGVKLGLLFGLTLFKRRVRIFVRLKGGSGRRGTARESGGFVGSLDRPFIR